MKREEILINATPTEVRTALVDSGVLQEVQIERTSRVGLVSNIYKGRVSRVLPGMQAAFVEIGLERTAFCMPPTSRAIRTRIRPRRTTTSTSASSSARAKSCWYRC
jgi:Rne/Rng family ribonuclease